MKIAYLTIAQHDELNGQFSTEYSIFCLYQDDQTGQYYLAEQEIMLTNMFDKLWVKDLELMDLPEYERYKFKITEV